MNILTIISSVLIGITGLITFSIGFKFLTAKEFFTYHKFVIGKNWEEIENPIKTVILAVFKMTGSGMVSLSLIMLYYSFETIFTNQINDLIRIVLPCVFTLFWIGSFFVTFYVFKKTKANTPWTGSLMCIVLLIAAIIIEIVNKNV
jgi:hypothetical protein